MLKLKYSNWTGIQSQLVLLIQYSSEHARPPKF